MTKKLIQVITAVSLVGSMLTACGSSQNDNGGTSKSTATTAAKTTATTTQKAEETTAETTTTAGEPYGLTELTEGADKTEEGKKAA